MKKFKLFGASTLALVGALSLVACNNQGSTTTQKTQDPTPTTTQTTPTQEQQLSQSQARATTQAR